MTTVRLVSDTGSPSASRSTARGGRVPLSLVAQTGGRYAGPKRPAAPRRRHSPLTLGVAAAAIAAAFLATTAFASVEVGAIDVGAPVWSVHQSPGDAWRGLDASAEPAAGARTQRVVTDPITAARGQQFEIPHDWQRSERRLEALPHHRAQIEGLDEHFVHGRSPYPAATPVAPAEGWFGSFLRGRVSSR